MLAVFFLPSFCQEGGVFRRVDGELVAGGCKSGNFKRRFLKHTSAVFQPTDKIFYKGSLTMELKYGTTKSEYSVSFHSYNQEIGPR